MYQVSSEVLNRFKKFALRYSLVAILISTEQKKGFDICLQLFFKIFFFMKRTGVERMVS